MVSGSTWPFETLRVLSNVEGLTALSTSKGYRTMIGRVVLIFCEFVDFNLDFFLFRKYIRPTRPGIPAGIPILSQ